MWQMRCMTWPTFIKSKVDYSVAEPLYQRVLSVAEKIMVPEHASVGIVLANLAELYHAQGRHAEAEPRAKTFPSNR